MLTNLFADRIQLQEKTVVQGALGQTLTWKPVQWKYAAVIPLSAEARAQYQQLNSVVTHKIILRGDVTITLGNYRMKHGAKIYEPAGPTQLIDGNTVIVCKEV